MGNYYGYFLLILYNTCIYTHKTKGNVIDVTVYNNRPLLNYDSEDTFFGGYRSGDDLDAEITFGRASETGTSGTWPPPGSVVGPRQNNKGIRIFLPISIGVQRIGAFFVDVAKDGVTHRMITITMSRDAGILPESATKTASIGQTVTLVMEQIIESTMLEWRFNGIEKPEWGGSSTVYIYDVRKADEGIYECYIRGHREQGWQAISRLIVRECPSLIWNPPMCDQECPICYNGGICDAQTGLCVCPPGFGGFNCEIVYGRNRWGLDGGLQCSTRYDEHSDNCKGKLLCRPDPYGCSCAAGYKGIRCLAECDSGEFGAGCNQRCHCEGLSCLLDTGECEEGVNCMAGWKGINCQVPDPCPRGYFDGRLGLCTGRCRCLNKEPCNSQNGYCNNGCESGYIGEQCDQDGLPSLTTFTSQEKVNNGSTTVLVCTVTGNPIPPASMVTLTTSTGIEVDMTDSDEHLRDYTRELLFEVSVAAPGEEFTCILTLTNNMSLQKTFFVDVYIPPVLTVAPIIQETSITENSVNILWQEWDVDMGGDGPIDKYIVKYRESSLDSNAPYTYSEETSDMQELSLLVEGLHWDTDYDFVVVAARAGENGEGPPSPVAFVTTKCAAPNSSVIINQVSALDSTALQVTWRLPPAHTWGCRTLKNIYVQWKESSSNSFANENYQLVNPGITTVVIMSLLPCTMYDVRAALLNSDGGLVSPISSHITGTAVPGPVRFLNAEDLINNPTQIQVTWFQPTANDCPVDSYQVTYRQIAMIACLEGNVQTGNTTVPTTDTTLVLQDLKHYSGYQIFVSAMNSKGEGDTTAIQAETAASVPTAAPLTQLTPPAEKYRLRFTWTSVDCKKINGIFLRYEYQLLNSSQVVISTKYEYNELYDLVAIYEDLTPCTDYYFRVRAATYKGYGPYSELTRGTTDTDVPGHVSVLRVPEYGVTATGMMIQWQEPISPPCIIDNYRIEWNLVELDRCNSTMLNDSASYTTRMTSYTATGLMPYSTYYVTVSAMTFIGYGPSVGTFVSTKESVPSHSPVNIIRTNRQKRSLSFRWDSPPCGLRRGNIIKYSYKLTDVVRNTEVRGNISDGLTAFSIHDLIPFVMYVFQVRAFTSVGAGPYSNPVIERTAEAKPGAPETVTTPSADSKSIRVRWYPPDPPQGNITTYYIIYWRTSDGRQNNRSITFTDVTSPAPYVYDLTQLTSQTEYTIQVQAETEKGRGLLSEPPTKRITEEGFPSVPFNFITTAIAQTSLTISWDPPREPNGNIQRYSVRYRVIERPYDKNGSQRTAFVELNPVPSTSPHTITVSGLEPSTRYEVQIAASTQVGQGPYAMISVYTLVATDIPQPESPPEVDSSVPLSDTSVTIMLVPVTSKYMAAYWIEVRKNSGKSRRQTNGANEPSDLYVVAELDKNDNYDHFIVGDNKIYGGYHNPPLEKGTAYAIRQGAVSKSVNNSHVSWGPPLEITAGTPSQGPSTGLDATGAAVGAVMGVLAVVFLVVVIVGFVFVRKRREKQVRMNSAQESNMMQLNNIIAVSKDVPGNRPQRKPKNINSEQTTPKIKHAKSDDALSNINPQKNTRGQGSFMKTSVHKPIRVDHLADYIKEKKAETKDGLKQEYMTLPEGQLHPWDVAMKPENKKRNRYANIIAYDHSRVRLNPLEGDPDSDYINACYIDGYKKSNAYIACQGPNVASTNDMWRMAWQEGCTQIVMVTNLIEGGKKKCEMYWPEKSKVYGKIEVTLTKVDNLQDYCARTFSLHKDGETRELVQFHFTSWPDMGVPGYAAPLLRFITAVKDNRPSISGPTIVHCSAGVGRTGTLITLNAMLDQAKEEKQIDVYNFIWNMRDRRIKMVQTLEQYLFIFDALLEALLCGDTSSVTESFCSEFHRLKTKKNHAGKTIMQEQFETLDIISQKPSAQLCRGGSDPVNINKNRYPERLPFDKFRPYLITEAGENCTNYINASFLDGFIRKSMFLATQAPLPGTVIDFWRLMYDYNSNTIVMLNAMNHNDATMGQYWPESGSVSFGPFTIELLSTDNSTDIIIRTFYLTNQQRKSEEPRKIRQFQYTGWPNKQDVPITPDTIVSLCSQVERWCPQIKEDSPITVHCRDGMGVSGTFCTIFMVLDKLKTSQSIDIFQAVKKLRMTRTNMVQTLAQFRFCFQTVLSYLDSMELYGNFRQTYPEGY